MQVVSVIASAAKQSSLPFRMTKTSEKLRGGASCERVNCGTEDWIASLRSQ
jgi:hypothetical protein